jgi:hypothetical protein
MPPGVAGAGPTTRGARRFPLLPQRGEKPQRGGLTLTADVLVGVAELPANGLRAKRSMPPGLPVQGREVDLSVEASAERRAARQPWLVSVSRWVVRRLPHVGREASRSGRKRAVVDPHLRRAADRSAKFHALSGTSGSRSSLVRLMSRTHSRVRA